MNLGNILPIAQGVALPSKTLRHLHAKENRTNTHLSTKVNGNSSNYCNKFVHIHTRLLSTNVHSKNRLRKLVRRNYLGRGGRNGRTHRHDEAEVNVEQLDKNIVGQRDAKRAVAVALRNRWRRQQLDDD